MNRNNGKAFLQGEFQDIPLEQLTDIQEIHIDRNLPKPQRITSYLEQVSHPYFFRCGEVAVEISFSPDGKTLQELLQEYLTREKYRE